MGKADLIGIVEAAYNLELDTTEWAKGICSAAYPLLDRGPGVSVHLFKPALDGRLDLPVFESVGIEPEVLALAEQFLRNSPPATSFATHMMAGPTASLSQMLGEDGVGPGSDFYELLHRYGIRDVIGIKALDVDGSGVMIDIPLPAVETPEPAFQSRWHHIAAHISAAYRLRRRLRGDEPHRAEHEAVLEPDGKCVHAEGEAKSKSAREALRDAVRHMVRARTEARTRSDEALAIWQALIEGRWSIVDRFDSDGRRLVIARKNEPGIRDPRGLLPGEAQVAAFAALGHPNNMIAYNLGLSEAAVAGHLSSALGKLGLESRVELARLFQPYPIDDASGEGPA